ncbi:urease accessory protein UreH domain-containing protein [Methylobacter tundripaludum]|uniref:Heavy metal transport/detoxification protein n=1 Tax=Methylobacter tundripaludum (strain ATCC BAA-1195 / DSM 17260 / SV96) TaxID=697282 RepID=G3IV28_METTV|nr:sulfite exporter TauE/SafE family protein [Methylobacter tundripaludum]EGW22824.1 Heavy metal transport/detoxification protein [Methylobacter tundripaludum SV96]
MPLQTRTFSVTGMHCRGCEAAIESAVNELEGIRSVRADFAKEKVKVTWEDSKTSLAKIFQAIEDKGYACAPMSSPEPRREKLKTVFIVSLGLAGIAALLVVGALLTQGRPHIPRFEQGVSYGLLFVTGLLTGFHCIGMCGGFVIGYTARESEQTSPSYVMAHLKYGIGKTLSYTAMGAAFGLLGSIVTFTPYLRGIAQLVAGVFLILFGLNNLTHFRFFRMFSLRMPSFLSRFVFVKSGKTSNPFVIGLLTGLMIGCGPLQAIYVLAAGTGSIVEGAKMLFVFGTGTLPVLLSFGAMTSLISHKVSQRLIALSGVIVIALGLMMFNRGLKLTGSGYDFQSLIHGFSSIHL